jgi:hypothetical protein
MSALGGHPGTPDIIVSGRENGRQWKRRRWPWLLAAALLLVAGALVVIVRPRVAAGDFRGLQARWAAAGALDAERGQIVSRLTREATPTDVPAVTAAVVALQRQEAGRLVTLRAAIGPGLAHDGGVSALAAAERTALGQEIGALRSGRPLTGWSTGTYRAIVGVQALLAAGRHRFGVPSPRSPRPARLTAADGTLLRLRRLLDERVPAELLVAVAASSAGPLQVIDLESGSIRPSPPALRRLLAKLPPGSTTFPLAGSIVVPSAFYPVYVIPPTLIPRRIGAGQVLPAGRPDAVWISDGGQPGRYIMVTVTGRRIAGPVPGPPDSRRYPVGLAVRGGLVVGPVYNDTGPLSQLTGLWLWNPLRGPTLHPVVRGCSMALAAHGTLLAWLRCYPNDPGRASLRITDTATGATRTIANPQGAAPFLADQPTAAFAPNGRWLASYYSPTAFGGYALGLVNIRTGAASIVRGAPVPDPTLATAVMWTSDSTRVFFATGGSNSDDNNPWADSTVPLATYRIGARSSDDVRLHETGATLFGVLPASGR